MFGYLPLYCFTGTCTTWRNSLQNDPYYTYLTNVLTITWAACYLFDAVLYWLALAVHDKDNRGRFVYWSAELGNVLASAAYILSQVLYFHPDMGATTLEPFARITVIQAAVYAGSLFLWAINSLQYFLSWRADVHADPRPKRFFLLDIGFWGEMFNIWPSLGYLGISLWGLIVLFPEINRGDFASYQAFYLANQTFQLIVNLAWDVGFTIDALLYCIIWNQDRKYYANGGGKYVELGDDTKKETLLDKGTYY
jgi:hypothetical protein